MGNSVHRDQMSVRPSDERRRQRRADARSLSYVLHGTGIAIFLWSWFWPYPYWLVITTLALLPWIAVVIVARSHGLLRLATSKRGGGSAMSLDTVFVVPALVLVLRAMFDVHFVTWTDVLPAALIGGLLVAGIVIAVDRTIRRRPWFSLFGIIVLTCVYAYGLAAEADTLFDFTSPQSFSVTVLGKHIAGNYRTPQRPYFNVTPWGPRRVNDDIRVGWDLFNSTKSGSMVCIGLYRGALGIPWYQADNCGQHAGPKTTFFQATPP